MNVEQCTAAIDEALALYNENMSVESVMFPVEVDTLVALSGENVERAATIYNNKAPDCAVKVELLERLHARLDLAAREFVDRNERASTELCERIEKEIVDSLRTLLDNYAAFCEAHDAGLARFEADSIGPAAPRVKERLLERVHLLQQTASMKARLDEAQTEGDRTRA
jgi:hypothetical protein